MSDAARPETPTPEDAPGWHNGHRAQRLDRERAPHKGRPWLRLLNDADQADGFEYHNPLVSIFYPQEGL